MKKFLAILLCLGMILAFTACGGNKKDIVGVWKLVDTEAETEYGLGIEFTKKGELRYGLTEDVISEIEEGEAIDDLLSGLEALMKIEYKIKSDTEMEITFSALFGLTKEKHVIPYTLDGDTLTFDGAVYTRAK